MMKNMSANQSNLTSFRNLPPAASPISTIYLWLAYLVMETAGALVGVVGRTGRRTCHFFQSTVAIIVIVVIVAVG